MATLLAAPRLTEKATAANALVDPNAASKAPEDKPEGKVCNDPDQMEELTAYIAGEMNANINSPSVRQMKDLNSFNPSAETRKYAELPFCIDITPKRWATIDIYLDKTGRIDTTQTAPDVIARLKPCEDEPDPFLP